MGSNQQNTSFGRPQVAPPLHGSHHPAHSLPPYSYGSPPPVGGYSAVPPRPPVPPPPPPPTGPPLPMPPIALDLPRPPTGPASKLPSTQPRGTAVTYTNEQINAAWVEHRPTNGAKAYFYNTITQISQFEKPPALVQQEADHSPPVGPWLEYTDASTGKKYYSNGNETTWEAPSEFAKSKKDSDTVKRKRKRNQATVKFDNKQDAVTAFKQILEANEITPAMKWNEVDKVCELDPKWDACAAVLTAGERKQMLAEFQTKLTNELKTKERHEKIRARDAFRKLLEESVGTAYGFSFGTARYADFRGQLEKDERFRAVAVEKERESMFQDFCDEALKREEKRQRNERRLAEESFMSFLREHQVAGALGFDTTWNSFEAKVDLKDKRCILSVAMSSADRLRYFAEFAYQLRSVVDLKQRRLHGMRSSAGYGKLSDYDDTLTLLVASREIGLASSWAKIEAKLNQLPSYLQLVDQDKNAPEELFERFMEDWRESFVRDRGELSRIVTRSNERVSVSDETTLEEFIKAILDEAYTTSPDVYAQAKRIINRTVPISSTQLYMDELRTRKAFDPRLVRRSSLRQVQSARKDDSSEDEGEIIEE